MDLGFSAEDRAFRREVEDFVRTSLPADIRDKVAGGLPLTKDDNKRWHAVLHEKGWIAPHWPVEYGGCGWSATKRYLFGEVMAASHAPPTQPFGLTMVGPVIYTFGTDAQKRRFLPKILSGEEFWCQGYSEPGSGSDLASLQTRAVRDGDDYVINGTKTWTSYAHWADWMFCLVRTDPQAKPQEGISFVLIDMTAPGIEVNPIITIDRGHHVNMTFLTDVRVPVANRVGEENRGWTYAKFLLGYERSEIAEVGPSKHKLRRLREIAAAERLGGGSLAEDRRFARALADTEVALTALEYANLRQLAAEAAGRPVGPEASLLKVRGSEIRQQITELAMRAVGYYAAPADPAGLDPRRNEAPVGPDHAAAQMPEYLFSRAATIYGGSNEIQRGIMAKMVLGL